MAEFDYTTMTPESVLEAANLAAEAARFMNHATLSPQTSGALKYPADVDAILATLEELGRRLPQLLDQLGAWLVAEGKAGRLRVTGQRTHFPATAAVAAAALRQYLNEAAEGAGVFQAGVHDARQITATLATAPEPREGE